MWTLKKQFKFEASHQLKHHDGKCARLHGHSWVGEVEVESSVLVPQGPKANMVMDYSDLKALIKPIEDELDHRHLNDVFESEMPTSELVAREVYGMLVSKFPRDGVHLKAVTINETCTSSCRYSE